MSDDIPVAASDLRLLVDAAAAHLDCRPDKDLETLIVVECYNAELTRLADEPN